MKLQRKEFVYPPFYRQFGDIEPVPSFDDVLKDLKNDVEFIIGPEKIISINELEKPEYTKWIVWYWSDVN